MFQRIMISANFDALDIKYNLTVTELEASKPPDSSQFPDTLCRFLYEGQQKRTFAYIKLHVITAFLPKSRDILKI